MFGRIVARCFDDARYYLPADSLGAANLSLQWDAVITKPKQKTLGYCLYCDF